ncbi:DUF2953 domain-containing protein [Herbinix luporum]|uniref:DUF2953 domain-containing protein n=1 Tax=Herbinix luporum TaxID=1679721 RepID=UPI0023F5131C|nr:DUF2953 domain-containing protein [Herbinix luporum]
MISVILTILKIIGLIFLALIGMLIFIITVVLFVPIRYRVGIEHDGVFKLDGSVSWLLRLVHAKVFISDDNKRVWIRVFGILVYDSNKSAKKTINNISKETIKKDIIKKNDIYEREDFHKPKEKINEEKIDKIKINTNTSHSYGDKSFSTSFFKKIKLKFISLFKNIKNKIKVIVKKFLNIRNKLTLILEFIKDDINKEGFRFILGSLKKIFNHIKPTRLKAKLIFGTGDPCSTGQTLGLIGILYSIYGENIEITPDFENKIFKGSLCAKGRIRLWTLLIIIIKLLLDKRFKELKMNYQLLK